jgi:hypothetical protein
MVTVNLTRVFTTIINIEEDERTTQITMGDQRELRADSLFKKNIEKGLLLLWKEITEYL